MTVMCIIQPQRNTMFSSGMNPGQDCGAQVYDGSSRYSTNRYTKLVPVLTLAAVSNERGFSSYFLILEEVAVLDSDTVKI